RDPVLRTDTAEPSTDRSRTGSADRDRVRGVCSPHGQGWRHPPCGVAADLMFNTNTKSPFQGLLGIAPWGPRKGLLFLCPNALTGASQQVGSEMVHDQALVVLPDRPVAVPAWDDLEPRGRPDPFGQLLAKIGRASLGKECRARRTAQDEKKKTHTTV